MKAQFNRVKKIMCLCSLSTVQRFSEITSHGLEVDRRRLCSKPSASKLMLMKPTCSLLFSALKHFAIALCQEKNNVSTRDIRLCDWVFVISAFSLWDNLESQEVVLLDFYFQHQRNDSSDDNESSTGIITSTQMWLQWNVALIPH